MVTLQIINKILATESLDIVEKNSLTDEYFVGYEEEFNFIVDHCREYGNVPDKATFVDKFNKFNFVDVAESDDYLLNTLYEEKLYYDSVRVVQEVAERLKTDSNDAVEYLQSQIENLQIKTTKKCTDIISQADERYQTYLDKMNGGNSWYVTTGFQELDSIINGWSKGEELAVIFARTGEGKIGRASCRERV